MARREERDIARKNLDVQIIYGSTFKFINPIYPYNPVHPRPIIICEICEICVLNFELRTLNYITSRSI